MSKRMVPAILLGVLLLTGVVTVAQQRQDYRAVCIHGPSITQIWFSNCTTQADSRNIANNHNKTVHGGSNRAGVQRNFPGIPRCS